MFSTCSYQSVLTPCDALGFVRVGIREAFDLTSFTAEQAVEIGADFVALAFTKIVTLRAACLEFVLVVVLMLDISPRWDHPVP